jgi:hypothetical protein
MKLAKSDALEVQYPHEDLATSHVDFMDGDNGGMRHGYTQPSGA